MNGGFPFSDFLRGEIRWWPQVNAGRLPTSDNLGHGSSTQLEEVKALIRCLSYKFRRFFLWSLWCFSIARLDQQNTHELMVSHQLCRCNPPRYSWKKPPFFAGKYVWAGDFLPFLQIKCVHNMCPIWFVVILSLLQLFLTFGSQKLFFRENLLETHIYIHIYSHLFNLFNCYVRGEINARGFLLFSLHLWCLQSAW